MDGRLAIRVVGAIVMTWVFWHFWAMWGLVLGLGMMMLTLP